MKPDLDKSLEQLEKKAWPEPDYPSYLVTTVHSLRKKPLKDFTTEDLRIVIGQSLSLDYLIPLAIAKLKQDILAEGHYYAGDLLNAVLTSDKEFWINHKTDWETIKALFEKNRHRFVPANEFRQIEKSYGIFETINK